MNSVYLFKEPAFSFIHLCNCFVSFSFIFALIFMISFLLLTLGFIWSFFSCFSCKVRFFIWDFSWEGVHREFGLDMYTLLYLKWITKRTYCTDMEFCSMICGSQNGRAVGREWIQCKSDWVPLLFTWNYHNIVHQL